MNVSTVLEELGIDISTMNIWDLGENYRLEDIYPGSLQIHPEYFHDYFNLLDGYTFQACLALFPQFSYFSVGLQILSFFLRNFDPHLMEVHLCKIAASECRPKIKLRFEQRQNNDYHGI